MSVTSALEFHSLQTADGPLEYALCVPSGAGPHPAILALPPGPQTRTMVAEGLRRWRAQMVADGFLVVSPVAPQEGLFTCGSAHARLPALLDHVESEHLIAGGRWHLFGISNGGRSALVVGPAYRERFQSVTVLPGATSNPESLRPLVGLPVTFGVGGQDRGWLESSQRAQKWLSEAGVRTGWEPELVVLDGQGHAASQSVSWATLKGWMTKSLMDAPVPVRALARAPAPAAVH